MILLVNSLDNIMILFMTTNKIKNISINCTIAYPLALET